jgi:predicted RNase H-like nuclease (RuvC/YqgF family)
MSDEATKEALHSQELQLVELVGKVKTLDSHCSRISDQLDNKIPTKTELTILQKEIDHLNSIIEKQASQITWLIRSLFISMLGIIINIAMVALRSGG